MAAAARNGTGNADSTAASAERVASSLLLKDPRLRRQARVAGGDPFSEIGTTGLRQFGGFVLEEWLTQLAGRRAAWAYREMLDNSSVVGAITFAIEMLARQAEWKVEGSDEDVVPGLKATEFVHQCMHDMTHTWGDTISEILSFLPYGWALHEEVFKKRDGEQEGTPSQAEDDSDAQLSVPDTEEDDSIPASSKYEDGLIGWRKLPVRAQETLLRWRFRGYSHLLAMEQVDWHGGIHIIPIEKCLLFRTKAARNNPEGRSILRNAWESWFYMKNIQSVEAIGIERDLAGIPELSPPDDVDIFAPQNKDLLEKAQEIVQSVRRDEDEGLVLPAGWKFRLVSAAGSRQIDTDQVIRRYRQEIASSVLADFILVGLDNLGSYAMVDVKAELFGLAVDAVLDMICEIFNRYGIPRLFRLNGFKVKTMPRINHSSSGRLDLMKVGEFLYKLAGSGAPIPWSEALIEQLFAQLGLPAVFPGERAENVHKAEAITSNVVNCARCGENHDQLRFAPLMRPVEQDGGEPLTHVAICPTSGQPVLLGHAPAPRKTKTVTPLTKAQDSTGAMVALYPSPALAQTLAQEGGEDPEELHLTLAYLGDASKLEDPVHLQQAVMGWASRTAPLSGQVAGHGHFTAGPDPVTYASVDSPALGGARQGLLDTLQDAGFAPSTEHGFTPHMTLAYKHLTPKLANPRVRFDRVAVVLGPERSTFPLRGVAKADADEDGVVPVAPILAARRRVLSAQLEQELGGALSHLGEDAATAYMSVAMKAEDPRLGALVRKVLAQLNIRSWLTQRVDPLLKNHAARVAGDTQRTLQTEVGIETTIASQKVAELEGESGRHLNVSDIEPQVRQSIMEAISAGLRAGDNPAATARRIREQVPPGRFVHAGSGYRARLIAVQETAHQQRLASLAAYDSNPNIGEVRVRDGIFGEPRSDEECIDRSGEIIPIADAAAQAPELHPQCTVSYDPVVRATLAVA